jgi:hypothetical protein
MKLASLAISLELAENLYEYGIRNESILYWYQEKFIPQTELFASGQSQKTMPWKIHASRPSKENKNVYKEFAAFTCSELGDLLPGFIKKDGITYFLRFVRHEKEIEYCYQDYNDKKLVTVLGKNEQDSRASLLCNILWNKFIDISQTMIK